MKLIYTTLNDINEARLIGKTLLEAKLANCVNFFPITCMYNWEDKITEEPEVVLIIKTKEGLFAQIQEVIAKHINYTNFIGEIDVSNVNTDFNNWLCGIVR